MTLWFWPSSCYQLKQSITSGTCRDEQDARASVKANPQALSVGLKWEQQVVERAQCILCHSDSTLFWFRHFYPEHAVKLLDPPFWSAPLLWRQRPRWEASIKPFTERRIDVLYVANAWARVEKNGGLMNKVIQRLRGLRIHQIGESSSVPDGVTAHGFLTHDKVLEVMGNAKVLVATSSYDAAPNTLFEGFLMGCNLVSSRNCGNWEICDPNLIAAPYTPQAFAARVLRGLDAPVEHHPERFLGAEPTQRLQALIDTAERGLSSGSPGRMPA